MIFEKIRAIICDQLEIPEDEVSPDTVIEDICPDSLDLIDIVMSLEDEFAREVPDEALDTFTTVGDIAAYIED